VKYTVNIKWFSSTYLQFAQLDAPFSVSDDREKLLLFLRLTVQAAEISPDPGHSLKQPTANSLSKIKKV